eukprot:CAMPEP_0201915748 /NCGR_PEP_ID=MMETSP0903-20130614/5584_1 /ASSEMBLY_ACC=CAM_ASM_000552 /TAXON_ID=420261 /ORGANISM="Thalassiosira antarctica, Strain CCMP982" /LENGTH=36 /DNA_ID= /DNA_START= /DNA_END= /DNA_ORIENTATION=
MTTPNKETSNVITATFIFHGPASILPDAASAAGGTT